MLNWLFPGSVGDRHESIRSMIAESSGEWIWDSSTVQNWVNGTSSNILICHGIRTIAIIDVTDS